MDISRIIVTGDFLRVNKKGQFCQTGNIRWLYHLLNPIFRALIPQIDVKIMVGEDKPDSLSLNLYRARAYTPDAESWLRLYDSDLNPRQLAMLHLAFDSSLVIAFELPDMVAKAISQMGIPFIDFTIHPVRFMQELVFGVRSNIEGIIGAFRYLNVNEYMMQIESGICRAQLSRLPPLPACPPDLDIGLFACQTSLDKVLIQNGKVVLIDDFMEEIDGIMNKHDLILVKPHPYEINGYTETFLTQLFPNTKLVKDNFYHLIDHENVTAVYSISSSTSIESKYFGCKGVHLREYPIMFSDSELSDVCFYSIRGCFLVPDLWRNILDILNVPVMDPYLPPIFPDYRKLLNSWWGADILHGAPAV